MLNAKYFLKRKAKTFEDVTISGASPGRLFRKKKETSKTIYAAIV